MVRKRASHLCRIQLMLQAIFCAIFEMDHEKHHRVAGLLVLHCRSSTVSEPKRGTAGELYALNQNMRVAGFPFAVVADLLVA
ncbi:hypothetical protein AAFX91_12680 [Bradyrhizobium sp. 31Argb]|uniref:hypothetical protein n=1 Tax=Bradyrhizobium sp. 31Argb TaxID=3141247 RepID=UPI003748EA81